jgi:mediator of RNA polymerase II transcription subunit 7
MPLPPMQFIMEYTDEAVRRGTAPLPPPPISDSYTMFGQPFSSEDCIVASLESQGIRRLYSAKEVDRKRELRKLNHSVLVNFLDLIDILIKTPDSAKREEKIEDLNLLFIHMHHLINEFRPHQARETLRVMLHVQKRKRTQVAEKFREHLDKVGDQIKHSLNLDNKILECYTLNNVSEIIMKLPWYILQLVNYVL